MIVADAFVARDRGTGLFFRPDVTYDYSRRDVMVRVVGWTDNPYRAAAWSEEFVDRLAADPGAWHRDLDEVSLEKVRAPACGCCGERHRLALRVVFVTADPADYIWRCAKHVGRNPCCIVGCRKTFAHKGDEDGRGPENYNWRMMCGCCWRQAPKWMRDRVSRIRRLTKRRGWTDQLHRLHSMAWDACFRRIVRARAAPEAAEPAATPPPPALLAELESLGF